MKVINDRTVYEFTNVELAKSFTLRCNKPMQILLGDAPFFWVASLGDAEWFVEQGYELLSSE